MNHLCAFMAFDSFSRQLNFVFFLLRMVDGRRIGVDLVDNSLLNLSAFTRK